MDCICLAWQGRTALIEDESKILYIFQNAALKDNLAILKQKVITQLSGMERGGTPALFRYQLDEGVGLPDTNSYYCESILLMMIEG